MMKSWKQKFMYIEHITAQLIRVDNIYNVAVYG